MVFPGVFLLNKGKAKGWIEEVGADLFSALLLSVNTNAVRVAGLQRCPSSFSTLPS